MVKAGELEAMIAPSLQAMGYEVVRVLLAGGRQRTQLQVMVERRDGRGLTVDDCALASRAVAALLEVEDPIAGAYILEVSSPGIDRPLVRRADFERFAGRQAKLETLTPIEGRRRFSGQLLGLAGDAVRVLTAEGETAVPLSLVHRAKLVARDAPGAPGEY